MGIWPEIGLLCIEKCPLNRVFANYVHVTVSGIRIFMNSRNQKKRINKNKSDIFRGYDYGILAAWLTYHTQSKPWRKNYDENKPRIHKTASRIPLGRKHFYISCVVWNVENVQEWSHKCFILAYLTLKTIQCSINTLICVFFVFSLLKRLRSYGMVQPLRFLDTYIAVVAITLNEHKPTSPFGILIMWT